MEPEPENITLPPGSEAEWIQNGAPGGAQWVMLGIILILLLSILAFMLRLRHLERHPKRELRDLQSLTDLEEKE